MRLLNCLYTNVILGEVCRAPGAVVVKPVKDISGRDLAMVCHFQRLQLAPPAEVAHVGGLSSINALCRDFVEGMQAGLPSAVSTIVRTASKLKVKRLTATTLDSSTMFRTSNVCPIHVTGKASHCTHQSKPDHPECLFVI